jgi:hypothetical protein
MTPEVVLEMETKMLRTFQAKEQREYFKEAMRHVAETMGDEGNAALAGPAGPAGNGAAGGSNPQVRACVSVCLSVCLHRVVLVGCCRSFCVRVVWVVWV